MIYGCIVLLNCKWHLLTALSGSSSKDLGLSAVSTVDNRLLTSAGAAWLLHSESAKMTRRGFVRSIV